MKETREYSQSITIDSILPQHIQENNSNFVDFLKAYYDWMESNGNSNNVLHKFGSVHGFVDYFANRTKALVGTQQNPSYDPFAKELYDLYAKEYSPSYPIEKVVREDLFVKSIGEILSCKGSTESIKTFFRLIYGEEVEVVFPENRRITYNSQSFYSIKTSIQASDPDIEDKLRVLRLCIGRFLYSSFGVLAKLQNVFVHENGETNVIELHLTNIRGGYFVSGDVVSYQFTPEEKDYFENITQDYGSVGDSFKYISGKLSFVVGGIITEYSIENPGTGYKKGETIILSTGREIESGIAVITEVGPNGEIAQITVTNSGFGFEASLKIDDNIVPDYTDGLYGGRIYSAGVGAILRFKAGASYFWDPRETISFGSQLLSYLENNSSLSGLGSLGEYFEETNSADPGDFLPYYQFNELGGYFEKFSDSSNPIHYAWVVARGNEYRNFGKLYFEHQIEDASDSFQLPEPFNFDSKFDSNAKYTFGLITSECQIPNKEAQLGEFQGSFGLRIRIENGVNFIDFMDEGSVTTIQTQVPTISNTKTIRFLVDVVEGLCYVGTSGGWFSGKTSLLTPNPQTPVFTNLFSESGLAIACSGRFIPQILFRSATRFSQMKFPIPEYIASNSSPSQQQQTFFAFDFDPFVVPVVPWDYSSATIENDEDEFKLTSEDVLYRYKIKSSISPRIWGKIYRACVHPVGTSYETEIFSESAYDSEENKMTVSYAQDWRPVIKNRIKSISDLQEYSSVQIGSNIGSIECPKVIALNSINLINQDLIVTCVETVSPLQI